MTSSEKIAIIYHELFNYTLSKDELKKWTAGSKLVLKRHSKQSFRVNKVQKIDEINIAKMRIAKDASSVLQKVPTVLFVGITGSLAMNNAKKESDIDLMVITQHQTLWLTRLFVMAILFLSGFKLRRAGIKDEQDKLCLNYWIDESALKWEGPQNAYIAHEIAQVIPLVNKKNIYEQWITKNKWIYAYWPYAIHRENKKKKQSQKSTMSSLLYPLNVLVFLIQKGYMSSKITRETVTLSKAHFHPYDWGQKVLIILKKKGVIEV